MAMFSSKIELLRRIEAIEAERQEMLQKRAERREELLTMLQNRLEQNPHLLDAMEGAGDTIAELRARVASLESELSSVKAENTKLRGQLKSKGKVEESDKTEVIHTENTGLNLDFALTNGVVPVTPVLVSRESTELRNTVLRLERENLDLRLENENTMKGLLNSSVSMSFSRPGRDMVDGTDRMREVMQGTDKGSSMLVTSIDTSRMSPSDADSFARARSVADEKVQNLREFIHQLRTECKELRSKIPVKPATPTKQGTPIGLKSQSASTTPRLAVIGERSKISVKKDTPLQRTSSASGKKIK
eukprot:CAMPEP_0182425798 /NCGR_PEP_ID=MMETSP1167-20130531/12282_1 /TAXON_ID=2988 /ORGANISM="Mallomonas Sp, Strain CCMP3275" /LENGTH=302 /DNA_ID=CAMNT_0024606791 /DNA_START=716 /DNA_END=1625 /DNA_ORIENTATION=-